MKDIKRDLPKGWKWVKISDKTLATIIMGQSPPGETYNKENIGLPFFQGKADFGNTYPEATVWCSAPKRIAEPNDILLSVRAPVGPTNIAKEKCCIGRGLAAFRCKEGLYYKYLLLVFRNFEKHISSGGAGSIFNAIGKDEIKAIEFPLPPTLDDQIAIANELEQKMFEVDAMRQAALRQKEASDATEGAILREVFPPKEQSKLPNGWKWKKLSEVCFINPTKRKGFTRESSLQTTFVPMDAIDATTGRISKIITRPYSEISKGYTFFEAGDVLFAKITPCMQNGKSAIANNLTDKVGFGSTEFHVLRPKLDITKEWAFFFVRTKEFRKRSEDHFEGSAGQQRVPLEFLESSLIPVPSTIAEQKVITDKIEQKLSRVESIRQGSEKQLEAIEAMPGAILREVFDFGKN
jgi:type I restriction enzyme S subunit